MMDSHSKDIDDFTVLQGDPSFTELLHQEERLESEEDVYRQLSMMDVEETRVLNRTITQLSVSNKKGGLNVELTRNFSHFLGFTIAYALIHTVLAYLQYSAFTYGLTFSVLLIACLLAVRGVQKHPESPSLIRAVFILLALLSNSYFITEDLLSDDRETPGSVCLICTLVLFRLLIFDNYLSLLVLSLLSFASYFVLYVFISSHDIYKISIEMCLCAGFLALNLWDCFRIERLNKFLFKKKSKENEMESGKERSKSIIPSTALKIHSKIYDVFRRCDNISSKLETAFHKILYKKIKISLRKLQNVTQIIGLKSAHGLNVTKLSSLGEENLSLHEKNFLIETCNVKSKKDSFDPPDLVSKLQLCIVDKFAKEWSFDVHEMGENCINRAAQWIYSEFSLDFLDRNKYSQFFERMSRHYKDIPFHNRYHATEVCHSLMYFLLQSSIQKYLSVSDLVNLTISSLSLDAGHPGYTNRFLISKMESQSLVYNDRSVLENMHASLCLTTLKDVELLDPLAYSKSRKLISELILSTDLSKHFQILSEFKARALKFNDLALHNSNNRAKTMVFALKCADLSYSAKPYQLHYKWVQLMSEEMFIQGDIEKSSGMQVSIYCERNENNISKVQIAFFRNICYPIYEVWCAYLNNREIDEHCLEQVASNMQYWETQSRRTGMTFM